MQCIYIIYPSLPLLQVLIFPLLPLRFMTASLIIGTYAYIYTHICNKYIHICIHLPRTQPTESISVVHMYICLGLTVYDWISYQRVLLPWRKLTFHLSAANVSLHPRVGPCAIPPSLMLHQLLLLSYRSCLGKHSIEISWTQLSCHV